MTDLLDRAKELLLQGQKLIDERSTECHKLQKQLSIAIEALKKCSVSKDRDDSWLIREEALAEIKSHDPL